MDRLLQGLFGTFIRRGTFKLTTSRGRSFVFGDGTGIPVAVRLMSRRAEIGLLRDPELKFGEAYMDGTLVVEAGYDCRRVGGLAWRKVSKPRNGRGRNGCCATPAAASASSIRASVPAATLHITMTSTAVSIHSSWMRTGSTAAPISKRRTTSLDDAQLAKKRHIAAKLRLDRDQSVLDIGCGWGGLGLYIAELGGANVTGVTLSKEQHAIANERAAEKGLSQRAHFLLKDYRDRAPASSTGSFRSACSSMSASATTIRFSRNAPSC